MACAIGVFLLQAAVAVAAPTPVQRGTQAPLGCDFYVDRLDDAFPCGPSGYARAYGRPYCEYFLDLLPALSPLGQAWLSRTLPCLQNALLPFLQPLTAPRNCREIHDTAFATHPTCYTQTGNSLCALDLPDLAMILSVLEKRDLLNRDGRRQIAKVMRQCLHEARQPERARTLLVLTLKHGLQNPAVKAVQICQGLFGS